MFIGARQPAGQAQANDLSVAHSSAHANGCAMEEPTTGAVSDPPRVRAQREDANEASRKLGKPVWRSSIGSGAFVLYVDDLSLETFAAPGCDVRMIVNADGSISCAEPNCIKPNFGAAKTKRSADAAAKHLRQVHLPELLVSTRNAAAAAAASIGAASNPRKRKGPGAPMSTFNEGTSRLGLTIVLADQSSSARRGILSRPISSRVLRPRTT